MDLLQYNEAGIRNLSHYINFMKLMDILFKFDAKNL